MRGMIGFLSGLIVVYLTCAALAWDFNPGDWSGFMRFWALCWAIPWGIAGAALGNDYAKRRVQNQQKPISLNRR